MSKLLESEVVSNQISQNNSQNNDQSNGQSRHNLYSDRTALRDLPKVPNDPTVALPNAKLTPAAPAQPAPEETAQPLDPPLDPPLDSKASKPKAPRNSRRIGLAFIGFAIALVAGGFGWRWWQYISTHETTDDAQLQGHVYPISSRTAGTIQSIAVTDNESVAAGQLLVQLDPQDFQAKVEQAKAVLAVAQQQAKAAQVGIAQG